MALLFVYAYQNLQNIMASLTAPVLSKEQLEQDILERIERKEYRELTQRCLKKVFERENVTLDVKQAQARR